MSINRHSSDSEVTLLRTLYLDYRRYRATGARSWVSVVLFTQGFWATTVYRICHRLLRLRRVPVLGEVVNLFCVVAGKSMEILSGICLPAECEIGPGLYIAHFGPTVLHSAVRLGSNCNLSQGVTIGISGRDGNRGAPVIGNRVFLGPHSIVFGPISLGNDVAIGAGAIVTNSLPDRSVAAGNPATALSTAGSFDFVHYDGMETDPARVRALNEQTKDRGETLVNAPV